MKKLLLSLVMIMSIILGSVYWVYADNTDTNNNGSNTYSPRERTNKLIYNLQKKLELGETTEKKILDKYADSIEILTLSGRAVHYRYLMEIDHAKISILELPDVAAVETDAKGYWQMKVVKMIGEKQDCSFICKHENYPECQTKVIEVCDNNIDDVTFQIPDNQTFNTLKLSLEAGISQMIGSQYTIDVKNKCQVFTTIGKSWASMLLEKFPHGEPGATAIISPNIKFPALGPIYFNEKVLPDPTLTKTSVDGGVFYANVSEGTYTLAGVKENVEFKTVKIKARPGIILNASPPYGIQGDQE